MDFDLPPELHALREEALDVGRAAAAQADLTEDTWIAALDRTFSMELGKRGWLGMTWPVEAGGGGRSPLERFVVFEALIGEGAPLATSWFADRQMGPTLLQFGTTEQQRTHHDQGPIAPYFARSVSGKSSFKGITMKGITPFSGDIRIGFGI